MLRINVAKKIRSLQLQIKSYIAQITSTNIKPCRSENTSRSIFFLWQLFNREYVESASACLEQFAGEKD